MRPWGDRRQLECNMPRKEVISEDSELSSRSRVADKIVQSV